MDKIKKSYIRWVFELDRRTPKYWTRQKNTKRKIKRKGREEDMRIWEKTWRGKRKWSGKIMLGENKRKI